MLVRSRARAVGGSGRWAVGAYGCMHSGFHFDESYREPGVPPAGCSGVDRCLVTSLIRRAGACIRMARNGLRFEQKGREGRRGGVSQRLWGWGAGLGGVQYGGCAGR